MPAKLIPLPIDAHLNAILSALAGSSTLVLTATPGAGKSTRLPPALLKSVSGKVAVLEPRRIAALSASMRVADEQGFKLGQEVGYQVRGESKLCSSTRLIFMTEAILLRRMIDDPELKEFELIVIDEFHERSLNQDLLMGGLKELQELGRDLKLLIMSATLDPQPLLNYWPDSSAIDVPGQIFPLELRYSIKPQRLRTDPEFYANVVDAVIEANQKSEGNILVFLPGTGEIRRVHGTLEEKNLSRQILPLHGSLSLQQQRAVLTESQNSRIILATNVAEASLTVPGVDFVIDTGLVKSTDFNWNSSFSRLGLSRISKFSAKQRAGRAARTKSGTCLRLWAKTEEPSFPDESPPEILRSDLSSALLWLSHFGVSDFSSFSWFEKPPEAMLKKASDYLISIGALNSDCRLTERGQKMLGYPLPPRLASLMLLAEEQGLKSMGALLCAILEEADFIHTSEVSTGEECDLLYRMELISQYASGQRSHEIIQPKADRILKAAQSLSGSREKSFPVRKHEEEIKTWLLHTHCDRLCRRRGKQARGRMQGGRGVVLDPHSEVQKSEFFVALQGIDIPGQAETKVALASGYSREFILEQLNEQVTLEETIEFDESKGQFYAKNWRVIGDLALEEATLSLPSEENRNELWPKLLEEQWDQLLKANDDLSHWVQRWKVIAHWQNSWENFFNSSVRSQFLELASFGKATFNEIAKQDLVGLLESLLNREELKTFHKEVPSQFVAPTGSRIKIHYEAFDRAYVEVRLQEVFGLMTSPQIAFGSFPLTFRLLAPNYRPAQVTSDLANFWREAYVEVRKELRSRYPKHSWPEDPYSAKPEAKGRPRKN